MDTQNPSNFSIAPQAFNAGLGRHDAPRVLDVRRQAYFDQSPRLVVSAQRCAPEDVVHCALEGGIVGGQEGEDDAQAMSRWRAQPPLTFAKRTDWGVTGERPSRWITRERPKIDRIACPWLLRRFIDTRAEFFYVPTAQVLRQAEVLGAVAYDIPGAPVSHVGAYCSFDALLGGFDLKDAALDLLATVVRGADTDRLDLSPRSAGLLAFSLGLSRLHGQDDHTMLEAAMPLYDALYAWCQDRIRAVNELHNSNPASREASMP